MGSSASKAARGASGAATRKYPSRIPPTGTTTNTTTRSTNAPQFKKPTGQSLGRSVHPETHASSSRDEAITLDASDHDLALNARLRQVGPVEPMPTMSNSLTFNDKQAASYPSTPKGHSFQPSASAPSQSLFPNAASNPAVTLLAARSKFAAQAEHEFEDVARLGKGKEGRRFLDVTTIRQILIMRDELGVEDGEIEKKLGLLNGAVKSLGRPGMVSATSV